MSAPGGYLISDDLAATLEKDAISALAHFHEIDPATQHFVRATLALAKDRRDRVEIADRAANAARALDWPVACR